MINIIILLYTQARCDLGGYVAQQITTYDVDASMLAVSFERNVPKGVQWPKPPHGEQLFISSRTVVLARDMESNFEAWLAAREWFLKFVTCFIVPQSSEQSVYHGNITACGTDGQIVVLDETLAALRMHYGAPMSARGVDLSGAGANTVYFGLSAVLLLPGLYSRAGEDKTRLMAPTHQEFQAAINKMVGHLVACGAMRAGVETVRL